MNYADAIVYLKENNITKEDGTFYEFGEVCSTYRENYQFSLVMIKMMTYNHCNQVGANVGKGGRSLLGIRF